MKILSPIQAERIKTAPWLWSLSWLLMNLFTLWSQKAKKNLFDYESVTESVSQFLKNLSISFVLFAFIFIFLQVNISCSSLIIKEFYHSLRKESQWMQIVEAYPLSRINKQKKFKKKVKLFPKAINFYNKPQECLNIHVLCVFLVPFFWLPFLCNPLNPLPTLTHVTPSDKPR